MDTCINEEYIRLYHNAWDSTAMRSYHGCFAILYTYVGTSIIITIGDHHRRETHHLRDSYHHDVHRYRRGLHHLQDVLHREAYLRDYHPTRTKPFHPAKHSHRLTPSPPHLYHHNPRNPTQKRPRKSHHSNHGLQLSRPQRHRHSRSCRYYNSRCNGHHWW